MSGQLQLTIALVCIGLFSVAVIGYAINFANDNNAAIDISDDSQISGLNTNTQSNLSGFSAASNSTYASIISTTISPQSGTAQSAAPFTLTPYNALGAVKNILQVGYIRIFGSNSGFGIFITAFSAMLVFAMGLLIYKALRGQPN